MQRRDENGKYRSGFSLPEVLAALVIGALVLVAVLGIYGQANRAAEAVLRKTEAPSLALEVLQLMAEDLGRTLGAEGTTLRIQNGFDHGFPRAEMILRRTYHDGENKEQVLEEIIWRTAYDYEGQTPGLVLYRSYDGAAPEDKLLDAGRAGWEKSYPFVPVCRGLTFLRIQACKGEDLVDRWGPPTLPPGLMITLSFAEPYETVQGTRDVTDDQKVSRTIAVDATRRIKFAVVSGAGEPNESTDPNQPATDRETRPDKSLVPGAGGSRGPAQKSLREQRPNEQSTRTSLPRSTRSR
jgi:prepilin-type N-terminal cleavage/methylation domain-containing protein